MNSQYITQLENHRLEIDKIDDEILNLLKKRIEVVKEVKNVKSANGEEFFIKSARESDMIKDLLKKSGDDLPKSAIIAIWRKIITSSNYLEQPITISLHNPSHIADLKYILREYYADFVPIISHDSTQNVMSDIENDKAQIAVFTLPRDDQEEGDNWWIKLASSKNSAKIFAKIPFLNNDEGFNLVALAKKKQEKSTKDKTLLCLETAADASKAHLLADMKKIGFLDAKILKTSSMKSVENALFYLFEVDGYYDEESPQIAELSKSETKPFVKILGCYGDNS